MRFITVRDLRSKSAQVWRDLEDQGDLVITSNGKPIAILTSTDEARFEQSLRELRQARALRSVKQLQEQSVRAGRDKVSTEEIEAEIDTVREARRG